jgi:hypothetical protein
MMANVETIGNYALYANTDNLLVVNGKGASWKRLLAPEMGTGFFKTRDVAEYAKGNGYSGVLFKNILDEGDQGEHTNSPSNVYVFFEPQRQVKSADPVTYDDSGNVIPLSERFNAANEDIRYSLREYGLQTIPADDQSNIKTRGHVIIGSRNELIARISEALADPQNKAHIFVGNIDKATRDDLEAETGVKLFRNLDYAFGISSDCIRHLRKHFDAPEKIADAVENIFNMLRDHDSVVVQGRADGGKNLILRKGMDEIEVEAPAWINKRTRSVTVKTAASRKRSAFFKGINLLCIGIIHSILRCDKVVNELSKIAAKGRCFFIKMWYTETNSLFWRS